FLADTGNNDEERKQIAVHEIAEPDPTKRKDGLAVVTRTWQLRYPKAPFDCESLFVWQSQGYVISKVSDNARAEIYRFSLAEQKRPATLEFVAQLRINSPVTGADLSPDGKLLGVVAKSGAFVYRVNGNIAHA